MGNGTGKFALAAAAALVFGACGDASESGDAALDRYLCNESDLGGGFLGLASGSFSETDLGGLGIDPGERKREYREAGMQRGRFIFWKERLHRPPFEPPLNVVCQVLVFETADQAVAWVDSLAADSGDIAASGIIWLPDGRRHTEEIEPIGGARSFRISAEEGPARATLIATYEAEGNIVWSVFAGDSEGAIAPMDVLAILERERTRIAEN